MMRRSKEMMGTGNCAPLALLQDHGDEEEDEDRGDEEVTGGRTGDRKDKAIEDDGKPKVAQMGQNRPNSRVLDVEKYADLKKKYTTAGGGGGGGD